MRITQEAKKASRRKILEAAQSLFQSKGYQQATTRDIAREAGIATGTLFNYFPTKEAIVMTLVSEALMRAQEDFEKQQLDQTAPLEEKLFAQIATGLRRMQPFRNYIKPLFETVLSPLVKSSSDEASETIRVSHLETVDQLVRSHGIANGPSAVALQLYWTLYTGVLAFWSNDRSPKQEDTLALLDQSLRMFVGWLETKKSK